MSEAEVIERLTTLQDDPTMHTESAYSPAAHEWPDHKRPFIEVHLAYLRSHKKVDARSYLSNLELMLKKR